MTTRQDLPLRSGVLSIHKVVELVLLNIYIYTSILILIFNLYITYFEILYDLYWVFPKSDLDTNIWMQIIHLGDDHEESERKRGKTETGAREKSDKCEFINGLSLWSTGTQFHWMNFWETRLWTILPGNGSLGRTLVYIPHTGQKITLCTSPCPSHPCQKSQFEVHSGTTRETEIRHQKDC